MALAQLALGLQLIALQISPHAFSRCDRVLIHFQSQCSKALLTVKNAS